MNDTTSWRFPNIFDSAKNSVAVLKNSQSITNRVKLLMLTVPGELYNAPDVGIGLSSNLWTYNNANRKAIIQNTIRDQLAANEPYVDSEKTVFSDSLISSTTSGINSRESPDTLTMTVGLATIYGDVLEVKFDGNN